MGWFEFLMRAYGTVMWLGLAVALYRVTLLYTRTFAAAEGAERNYVLWRLVFLASVWGAVVHGLIASILFPPSWVDTAISIGLFGAVGYFPFKWSMQWFEIYQRQDAENDARQRRY